MQWESDGRSQWFEASGVGRQSGGMTRPVPGGVTSGLRHALPPDPRLFAHAPRRRFPRQLRHADRRRLRRHASRCAGWARRPRQPVELNHAGGLATSTRHMSRIAVRAGRARPPAAQVIGYVGSTGLSTGPHLHFEVHRNGVAVNPRSARLRRPRAARRAASSPASAAACASLLGTPVGAAQRAHAAERRRRATAPLAVIPAKPGSSRAVSNDGCRLRGMSGG